MFLENKDFSGRDFRVGAKTADKPIQAKLSQQSEATEQTLLLSTSLINTKDYNNVVTASF